VPAAAPRWTDQDEEAFLKKTTAWWMKYIGLARRFGSAEDRGGLWPRSANRTPSS